MSDRYSWRLGPACYARDGILWVLKLPPVSFYGICGVGWGIKWSWTP